MGGLKIARPRKWRMVNMWRALQRNHREMQERAVCDLH
eukprot:COSAG04_NODE_20598_length_390_cov_0.917526_1_plen_37_part_10